MWYMNLADKVKWARIAWSSLNIPRHSFMTWVLLRNRIPVRARLARFTNIKTQCQICQEEEETQEHLFYNCKWLKEVWEAIGQWISTPRQSGQEWLQLLLNCKGPQHQKRIWNAVFTATIYHIRDARNQLIFKDVAVDKLRMIKTIKEEVVQRILYRAKENKSNYRYIDGLLR